MVEETLFSKQLKSAERTKSDINGSSSFDEEERKRLAAEARRAEAVSDTDDLLHGVTNEGVREVVTDTVEGVNRTVEVGGAALNTVNFIAQGINTVKDYWDDPADLFGFEDRDEEYMKNKADYVLELTKGMPENQVANIMDENNYKSALIERNRILREQKDLQIVGDAGAGGVAAMLIGGFLDVDTLAGVATGGLSNIAKIAKIKKASDALAKSQAALKNSVSKTALYTGAKTAAVVGGIELGNQTLKETSDWVQVPTAGLFGLGLGGAIGGFRASKMQKAYRESVARATDEFDDAVAKGHIGNKDIDVDQEPLHTGEGINPEREIFVEPSTPKPRDRKPSDKVVPGEAALGEDHVAAIIQHNKTAVKQKGLDRLVEEAYAKAPPYLKAQADRMNGFFKRNPSVAAFVQSDFDRLMKSESATAKMFAYEFFESPHGTIRNNRSATMLEDMYQRKILTHSVGPYTENLHLWASTKGYPKWKTEWNNDIQKQFGDQVTLEMNYRRLNNGASKEGQDAFVTKAADELQVGADNALAIAKGQARERSVLGMEDVDGIGYTPLIHVPARFRDAKLKGQEEDVIELYTQGYASALPHVDEATRRIFARALVTRKLAQANNNDDSMLNVLTGDGRIRMHETLVGSGVKEDVADKMIALLEPGIKDKGKAGFAKRRTEIDLSVEYKGLKLIDFVDTNMTRVWSTYARGIAGRSAMARKGVTSKDQFNEIKKAIKKEQDDITMKKNDKLIAEGKEPTAKGDGDLEEEFMDHMISYFEPGPVGQGLSDNIRRIKQMTNLVLLNQLGLTQLAETGAIIAASGIENFVASSKIMQKLTKGGANVDHILDELGFFSGKIGDEHVIFRDDLALDMLKKDAKHQADWQSGADKFLGKAQRLQGFTSGFYKVRQLQQRIAIASMTNTIARHVKGIGKRKLSDERIRDLGFDKRTWPKIEAQINKHAEFNEHGHLDKLNFEKWPHALKEEWSLAMHRHTNQVVQKAMAGESSAWMHKDVGALLSHLKQFPLLAMQKQFMRNNRIMDDVAAETYMYGLATATMAFTTKQLINGNTEHLTDPAALATGSLALSNMTGFVPMLADPIASMFGMDDMRFSRYGQTTDLLNIPAISVINKAQKVPGQLLEGDTGKALQSAPIVGNAYGFNLWFRNMREGHRTDKKEDLKAEKAEEKLQGGGVATDLEGGSGGDTIVSDDITDSVSGLTQGVQLTDFEQALTAMESDHGSTPADTKDAREKGKANKSRDIGFGHKITSSEEKSGTIHGRDFKKEGGLTAEDKNFILKEDMKVNTLAARKKGWDKKLAELGGAWDQLDPKFQNALSSMAYNMGGTTAGKFLKAITAAHEGDVHEYIKQSRRQDAGKWTAGMDNRALKEAFAAGLIKGRSEVADVLPKSNARQASVPE